MTVNGVRLYYEEHGSGEPILCIHATSSSALVWGPAVEKLAELGRVIVYDRRGCTRSERPEPYETTSVGEHANDAHELLRALDAEPAIVIGRSTGGIIALDLALRHPDSVRALVLLEADPAGLSAEHDAWVAAVTEKVERAAAEQGMGVVGETLIREVLGEWEGLPRELREMFSANGPAILAELRGDLGIERARPVLGGARVMIAYPASHDFGATDGRRSRTFHGRAADRGGGFRDGLRRPRP